MEALLEFLDARHKVDFFLPLRLVSHRDWISAQQLDPFQELNEPPIAAGNRVAAEPRAPLEPRSAVALVRGRWRDVLRVQVLQRRVRAVGGLGRGSFLPALSPRGESWKIVSLLRLLVCRRAAERPRVHQRIGRLIGSCARRSIRRREAGSAARFSSRRRR